MLPYCTHPISFSMASYCYVLKQEVAAYEKQLDQVNAGYLEFMSKPVRGHKLYEYVNPHTVGTFKIDGQSFACATLIQNLTDIRKKD